MTPNVPAIVPFRSQRRIGLRIEIASRGKFSVNAAVYFAIAGARLVAFSTCGRISVVFALSWIGGRGSFAVPGSMTKV